MLLLQLDMLAYADESGDEPVLVVGGGVPSEWTGQAMGAKGLHTNIGRADWRYANGEMTVDFYTSGRYAVRAGTSFPKDTKVKVQYHNN